MLARSKDFPRVSARAKTIPVASASHCSILRLLVGTAAEL